ncbi:Phospholipase A1-Igamma1 chloroplastic, partial [Bienertia sinuspersici]
MPTITEFSEGLPLRRAMNSLNPAYFSNPVSLKEEVIFQDKEIICEENIKSMNSSSEAIVVEEKNEKVVIPDEVEMEAKASYGRSKSEKLRRENGNDEEKKEKLRRSETEICWRSFAGNEESDV